LRLEFKTLSAFVFVTFAVDEESEESDESEDFFFFEIVDFGIQQPKLLAVSLGALYFYLELKG
jgi:hypothetical protein